jgi:hypothetical protein
MEARPGWRIASVCGGLKGQLRRRASGGIGREDYHVDSNDFTRIYADIIYFMVKREKSGISKKKPFFFTGLRVSKADVGCVLCRVRDKKCGVLVRVSAASSRSVFRFQKVWFVPRPLFQITR